MYFDAQPNVYGCQFELGREETSRLEIMSGHCAGCCQLLTPYEIAYFIIFIPCFELDCKFAAKWKGPKGEYSSKTTFGLSCLGGVGATQV